MLGACASGYTSRKGRHNYQVRYRDRIFLRLPTGEHGKIDPEIQIGLVRGMVRQLGINWECAAKHIPLIGKGSSKPASSPELQPKKKPPEPPQPKKGGGKKKR